MSIVEEDEEDSGITIKVKSVDHEKKVHRLCYFLHIIAPQILSLGVKRNVDQSLEHPFSHNNFTQNRKYVILHSALSNYSIFTKLDVLVN